MEQGRGVSAITNGAMQRHESHYVDGEGGLSVSCVLLLSSQVPRSEIRVVGELERMNVCKARVLCVCSSIPSYYTSDVRTFVFKEQKRPPLDQ